VRKEGGCDPRGRLSDAVDRTIAALPRCDLLDQVRAPLPHVVIASNPAPRPPDRPRSGSPADPVVAPQAGTTRGPPREWPTKCRRFASNPGRKRTSCTTCTIHVKAASPRTATADGSGRGSAPRRARVTQSAQLGHPVTPVAQAEPCTSTRVRLRQAVHIDVRDPLLWREALDVRLQGIGVQEAWPTDTPRPATIS